MSELPILVYDGDCAFCSSTIRLIQRRVSRHPNISPYQNIDLAKIKLTKEDCQLEIKYVSEERVVYSGVKAFANFFLQTSFPWRLLGYLLKNRFIAFFGRHTYNWVARNRYRLPGGTPSCQI